VGDPGRFRLDSNCVVSVGGGFYQFVQLGRTLAIGRREVDLMNEGAGKNGANSGTEQVAGSQVLKSSDGGANLCSRIDHWTAALVHAPHGELRFTDDD
jgi:hypothetical protein